MAIQIRRGTDAEWEAGKQNIVVGEPCVTTDTGRFFVGTADGFSEMARMEDIGTFEESIESLQGDITEINEALETKADKSDTYSKEDVDGLLDGKASTEALEELSDEMDSKADADSVYTKSETDTLLSGKASASDLEELEEEMADYRQMYLDSLIHTTASGSIASFSDGADGLPMDSCTASIEPVQDLHGQANPYPAGGGVNKWDEEWESGQISDVDGSNVNGANYVRSKNYVPVLPNEAYCITSPYVCYMRYYDEAKTYIGKVDANNKGNTTSPYSVRTIPNNCRYVRFYYSGTTYNHDISINYPSTDTSYHPYSNICPISGFTGCEVKHTGVNLVDGISKEETSATVARWCYGTGFKLYKGVTYTLSTNIPQCTVYFSRLEDNTSIKSGSPSATYTPTEDITIYFRAYLSSGVSNVQLQLEVGSTATAYDPYTANTYSVTWEEQGTVYGGSVDLVSGLLTADAELEVFDTVENNTIMSQINSFSTTSSSVGVVGDYARISFAVTSGDQSRYNRLSNTYSVHMCNLAKHYFAYNDESTHWYRNSVLYLFLPTSLVGSTAQSVFDYLVSIKDTNPLTFWIPLTEPTTYQLTPQEITTLIGSNNVWADTGDTSVGYIADTKLYIDSKLS